MHVFEQPLHLLAGEYALCQIMYSLAALFWRNDLGAGCASVIPSEQTASSYIILYWKPSRCLLCAVPRYWNVAASCFRFIGLAENTSAALAPSSDISQSILLLFFFVFLILNLSTKRWLDFFIRSQNLVAFKRRQDWLKKGLFQTFPNIKRTSG